MMNRLLWQTHAGKSPFSPTDTATILFDDHRVHMINRSEGLANPVDLFERVCDWMASVKEATVPVTQELFWFDWVQLVEYGT